MGLKTLRMQLAAFYCIAGPYISLLAPIHVSAQAASNLLQPILDSRASDLVSDDGDGVSYLPDFGLFDRSVLGRAPAGFIGSLKNNRFQALNLDPEGQACYQVPVSTFFPNLPKDTDSQPGGEPIYISASTCLHPYFSKSDGTQVDAPQLMLYVTNSTKTPCPKSTDGIPKDDLFVFEKGAVMWKQNMDRDLFVTIFAPSAPKDTKVDNVYAFEVAASSDTYFHSYDSANFSYSTQLLWMDSDSSSALLMTRNLTDSDSVKQKLLKEPLPYELFAENDHDSTVRGVENSVCGLQTYAQISANTNNTGKLNTLVRTSMTTRGQGNWPKQEFYFAGLNSSSNYTGILVEIANSSGLAPRDTDGTKDGVIQGGGHVFYPTKFSTLSGTNCKLVTDLDFCDEIQYAVPGNDKHYNMTQLAKAYDEYAKGMYEAFEKVMMQIPCETSNTARYSLARTCDDCKKAYKRWLCTVSLPRCVDYALDNPSAVLRNANQSYANGTKLPQEAVLPLQNAPYNLMSRNPFIYDTIQPGPYKEILPCEDICYEVVQSCPAAIGFTCPRPGNEGFQWSYGRRDKDPTKVTCNYPGEARTIISAGRVVGPRVGIMVMTAVVAAFASTNAL